MKRNIFFGEQFAAESCGCESCARLSNFSLLFECVIVRAVELSILPIYAAINIGKEFIGIVNKNKFTPKDVCSEKVISI